MDCNSAARVVPDEPPAVDAPLVVVVVVGGVSFCPVEKYAIRSQFVSVSTPADESKKYHNFFGSGKGFFVTDFLSLQTVTQAAAIIQKMKVTFKFKILLDIVTLCHVLTRLVENSFHFRFPQETKNGVKSKRNNITECRDMNGNATPRRITFGSFAAFASVIGLSLIAGCGDDSQTTSTSTGQSTSSSGSVSSSSSSSGTNSGGAGGVGGEAGNGGTGGVGGNGGTGGAGGGLSENKPTMVALSENGHDRFLGVTHDAQGNIYATGIVTDGTDATADFKMVVAKFLPTGEIDKTFGADGFAIQNVAVGTNGEVARGIVVQSTGKIVIAGTVEHVGAADARDRDIAVVRFNANGTLDTTFGTNGIAILDLSDGELVGTTYIADTQWGLSLHGQDKLIVTGAQKAPGRTDLDFAVVQLEADGKIDTAFGTNGVALVDINQQGASPRNALVLADGSFVVTGYTRDVDSIVSPVMFKLTPTGQLDSTFGVGGIFNQIVLGSVTEAYAATLQGTNFVTAGYGRNSMAESLDWISLRIGQSGTLDTAYGENGVAKIDVAGFNDNARSIVTLPDNRLLLVGGGRTTMENSDAMVGILTADGKADTTFGTNGYKMFDLTGASDFFWAADIAPDKKSVAIVGASGVAMGMGDDDAAILILPTTL